mmetsp:Transcript_35503/g.55444  ORF Transcript_35503/g.55444 Transcript_35503/m.55444 type:complete len:104 (-) Transcript_35503:33-344(-)
MDGTRKEQSLQLRGSLGGPGVDNRQRFQQLARCQMGAEVGSQIPGCKCGQGAEELEKLGGSKLSRDGAQLSVRQSGDKSMIRCSGGTKTIQDLDTPSSSSLTL